MQLQHGQVENTKMWKPKYKNKSMEMKVWKWKYGSMKKN